MKRTATTILNLSLLLIVLIGNPAQSGVPLGGHTVGTLDLENPPVALDGNTLAFGNFIVRLFGIDAPTSARMTWPPDADQPEALAGQSCKGKGEVEWPCGDEAARALEEFIGNETVTCRSVEGVNESGLGLGPGIAWIVSMCWTSGEAPGRDENVADSARLYESLNARMVRSGNAVAWPFSDDFVEAETEARRACRGMHGGGYVTPWLWELGVRLTARAVNCG